jgi:hypothetical protein
MAEESPELREALLYTRYSLFITIVTIPFGFLGYVLRDSSSFALEVASLAIVGLLTLIFWYRKLNKLRNR